MSITNKRNEIKEKEVKLMLTDEALGDITVPEAFSNESKDAREIGKYLSRKERRKWNRFSDSKKERIIEKARVRSETSGQEFSNENRLKDSSEIFKNEDAGKNDSFIEKSISFSKYVNVKDVAKIKMVRGYISKEKKKELEKKKAEKSTVGSGNTQSALSEGGQTAENTAKSAGEKTAEATGKAVETTVEAGGSVAAGAATGGISEGVKVGAKAVKKVIGAAKKAVNKVSGEVNSGTNDGGGNADGKAIDTTPAGKVMGAIAGLGSLVIASFGPLIMAIIPVIIVVSIITSIITMIFGAVASTNIHLAVHGLSEDVLKYQSTVEKYAAMYNVEDYVNYLLVIMQIESGGHGSDVMQSSESLGLPPNSLEPEASIEQGVKYFSGLIRRCEALGCDIYTAIQAYNYGPGFITFVSNNGKKYSLDLAIEFAKDKSGGVQVTYSNPVAVAYNGGWRYKYGNMFYVKLMDEYMYSVSGGELGACADEAYKYLNVRYVWGGSSTSGIDCSGLTQKAYSAVGINLPHSAQDQFNMCTIISEEEAKPGDLIFFRGTSDRTGHDITHCGIYLGNGEMIHASSSKGVIVASFKTTYYQNHFAGIGRINN